MSDNITKRDETLLACPVCQQANFTMRGLKAHHCRAKVDRAKLTASEITQAFNAMTQQSEPTTQHS